MITNAYKLMFAAAAASLMAAGCGRGEPAVNERQVGHAAQAVKPAGTNAAVEVAILGAGCFWCTEAVYSRLPGVIRVTPGYAGGHVEKPSYKQVCTGKTGHAEVARLEFDPKTLPYAQLLDTFWHMHDPTTLNRQGADEGTQYRSVIFCTSEEQKQTAEASRAANAARFKDPIVTEILPAPAFYPAEDYHQEYYDRNAGQPYCQAVIRPKLEKLGLKP